MNGLGKVDRDFLQRVILKNTGVRNHSVVLGPGVGLDNSVVSFGRGKVMVITADPLSMIPALGMKDSAWLTIHELASDIMTSAVRPQFAMLDYNLPPRLKMSWLEEYVAAMSAECKKLGIAIAGGHTGKYPGCDFTIVGGGVLMGIAGQDDYLTPSMSGDGDAILMTKGAAIETTGVLSRVFPKKVREAIGKVGQRKAARYFEMSSTFEDALAASSVGIKQEGVTSMHDATEGGVLGGLYELALSSQRRIRVDSDKIFISDETGAVCSLFGIDPLLSLSEGTLLLTCRKKRVDAIQAGLDHKGIESFVIGQVTGRAGPGLFLSRKDSATREFSPPKYDPYWKAYALAEKRGWT